MPVFGDGERQDARSSLIGRSMMSLAGWPAVRSHRRSASYDHNTPALLASRPRHHVYRTYVRLTVQSGT